MLLQLNTLNYQLLVDNKLFYTDRAQISKFTSRPDFGFMLGAPPVNLNSRINFS